MSYTLEKITFIKAFISHACRARNLLIWYFLLHTHHIPGFAMKYITLFWGENDENVLLIHTIFVLVLTAVVMSTVSMRRTNDVNC